MGSISYFNQTTENIKELDTVKKVIEYAVKREKVENAVFNIIIVDNEYIHKINREYRNIDRETDVITFALEDSIDEVKLDVRILGDIYISLDKAISQAEEYGHSLERELSFLAVHGFLHLLGYDHTLSKEDEKIMFDKQEEILNECSITR